MSFDVWILHLHPLEHRHRRGVVRQRITPFPPRRPHLPLRHPPRILLLLRRFHLPLLFPDFRMTLRHLSPLRRCLLWLRPRLFCCVVYFKIVSAKFFTLTIATR